MTNEQLINLVNELQQERSKIEKIDNLNIRVIERALVVGKLEMLNNLLDRNLIAIKY